MEPPKTVPQPQDVHAFLATVPDAARRADADRLVSLMSRVTGTAPQMWGPSIVGFGTHHYRYETGREGDTVAVGFAPRKAASTLYLTGYLDDYAELLEALGPHTTGKGCLYIKRLDAVDEDVLGRIVRRSFDAATPAG